MATSWPTVPLRELIQDGRRISYGVVQPGGDYPGGTPIVRVSDIRGGRIATDNPLRIAPERVAGYNRTTFRGGELLLTLVGTVGETAIVPAELAGWNAARAVAVIPVREDVGAYWVHLCLKRPDLRQRIHERLNTTVQATLNLSDVAELPIPLPAATTRAAIVDHLRPLENKIELNRGMNETLDRIASTLFRSWFVEFDPVRAKAEGRATGLPRAIDALFPDQLIETHHGEVPEGWALQPIGNLVEIVGGSTPRTNEPRFWEGGTIHWATPKDLSGLESPALRATSKCVTEEGLAQISSGVLPPGTVLLSSRAPIGYRAIAEIPLAINQGFIALKPGELPSTFLLRWLEFAHDEIISRANGTTFLEISKRNFREIPLVVPPAALLQAYDQIAEPLHRRIIANDRQSDCLREARDTLLSPLLTGQLLVEA